MTRTPRDFIRPLAFCLAGALSLAPPAALAQEPPTAPDGLNRLETELDSAARRAAERLARAVEMALGGMTIFVDSLPAYQAPEILPNGDILIRRIPKEAADVAPAPAPGAAGSDEAVEL
ncbi:hypothetical protein [Neomegalonema sp.]|uniref:hypothetical protein n=1 Tax=Neomegalonema sp. TaxID=2039713 RepID=UPI002624FE9F|nr:hypothetical protein [Neomegalonema sp.]MDD2868110.1 hypothetical protein [Neomegalonema sp.]